MKCYKSSLTIQASVIVVLIIYICLFFVDASMYIHDKNVLNNNLLQLGLRIQNYYECGEKNNKNLINFRKTNDAKKYLEKNIKNGYAFSKYVNSNIKLTISDIHLMANIKYIGMTFPFNNIEIEENIKLALITPAMDLRINKEIKHFTRKK